jgi:hypothetical protein
MKFNTNEEITEKDSNEAIEEKQHFINDDKYFLLQQCQQSIYKATEVSPSIRKLVNELVTSENLEKIKMKLIDSLSK